jgi:23S rRNA (uracil1939-C5)-methyltransferase
MSSCEILPPGLSALLLPLRELISGMDERDRLPQIEFALGDATTALVLRHLQPLGSADLDRLREFGARHHVQWWLQAKGPDSARAMQADAASLAYTLPEFGIEICFTPTDFTQVNSQINRVLVESAIRLLDPQRTERVIDWFCGLGNFTLPIATLAREVLGVEGSETLVQRARDNALRNSLQTRSSLVARNLFDLSAADLAGFGHAQKWLIDPPREGAFALAKALADLHENPPGMPGEGLPQRIVYVSCNPATLARDAGLLVHRAGYLCTAAGAVNMFPHTAHVESIAVFERGEVASAQSGHGAPVPQAP